MSLSFQQDFGISGGIPVGVQIGVGSNRVQVLVGEFQHSHNLPAGGFLGAAHWTVLRSTIIGLIMSSQLIVVNERLGLLGGKADNDEHEPDH